ncbi:MAG: PqqD family peptide modification chaperone [Planctomycetota bacterium]
MSVKTAHPRLRGDLVFSRQHTPEGPRFVMKDPRKGGFFRLREAESAVVRRLDGATPLEAVAAGVASELGVEATAAELEPFVAQLERRGLLESGADPPAARRRPLFRGSFLWLRLAAFDPDRLLGRLVGKVRFCFTSYFVVGGAMFALWALATTIENRFEIGDDVARLWRFESLFLVWLTILGTTTLHEFAHGLTCKRFGGEVHEMGFLLIYLQPALYCDISDAYLFPQKSRRLWVTAAGAYLDLVLWALATLAWRVVERDMWISSLALVVMATTGVRTFFNLNPLIKLDGYYLLTDLIDVPNLRPRAFAYLGSRLKWLWGGTVAVPEASPRERRIFVVYGLLAGVFSYWLLTQLFLALGGYLTAKYQGWGFVMISGLFLATFGRPLKSLMPRVRFPLRRALLLLAAAALVYLGFQPMVYTVSGEFELLPGENADVRAEIEGVLEEIYVNEGARVAAQDPIARVSDRDLRTRLAMADAEIGEHEARLRQLQAGPRREELEVARVVVRKAEDRLTHGRAERERMRNLAATGLVTREELDRSEQAEAVLARELEEASARLRELEAGCPPEEIAAVEQQIARARAERAQLQEEIARAIVKAPHGGFVTTRRLREKVGEYMKRGDLIAEVHEVETMTAEVAVPERDIGAVRAGMDATLRFRAYPERTFSGTVAAVAPAAMDVGSRGGRIVRVSIRVENADGLLRPNLTGYARIHAGERKALSIMTSKIRRFVRLEFWSWW